MSTVEDRDPGIDILWELADEGEIDPWDVDIVRTTDSYLKALERKDLPLPAFGKALYYAACLIRLKATLLAGKAVDDSALEGDPLPEPYDDPLFGDEEPANGGGAGGSRRRKRVLYDVPDPFPEILARRRDRKMNKRGITLDDLVGALRTAEQRQEAREEAEVDDDDDLGARSEEALEVRHTDDIEGDCDTMRGLLDEVLAGQQGEVRVAMEELVRAGFSPVKTYMSLLFLAFHEEVRLEQDDFYGELYIARPAEDPA